MTGHQYPTIDISALPTERQRVEDLLLGDSPRLSGECASHTEMLAQVDHAMPPIVVHKNTMKVIDGFHRLRAAAMRGEEWIEVKLFDGDEVAAFILAVEANILHGLPLSLADRTAAAERIVRFNPAWSDRAIAASTGLAASTVKLIRERSTASIDQLNARIGRDGRVRPLRAAEGRRRASELITEKPTASLREIAREAGISAATVRDVRQRLDHGEDPVPGKERVGEDKDQGRTGDLHESSKPTANQEYVKRKRLRRNTFKDPSLVLEQLRQDPSLRMNEGRRIMLQWLGAQLAAVKNSKGFIDQVPPHSYLAVAQIARSCAATWTVFAEELEQRSVSEAI